VRDRDEAVVAAMPDAHRHLDPPDVESPIAEDRDVVVEPSPDPVAKRLTQLAGDELGVLAAQHLGVRRRDEVAQLGEHLVARGRPQRGSPAVHELLECLWAGAQGGELLQVLLAHAVQPVEPLGIDGGDAGDRRGADHALG
jgi:hypothetical protein